VAVTNTPIFTQAPRLSQVQLANANNASRDGVTGTYSAALGVGANGSLVDYVCFKATTGTTAGTLRLFYSPDSGTTWRLLDEVATATVTPTAAVPAASYLWTPPGGLPLGVPSTGQFKFSFPGAAETWTMYLAGGDY
jgi:hypothetical protein